MRNSSSKISAKQVSTKEKVFCVVFGLFLTLVALELFLRFLGFGYNLLYRTPDNLGSDYRIFCVGESTTWGIGASDPVTKGYPRQLEEMLNKKFTNLKIQCLFDNTIGQNTSENLIKLPKYIKRYKPQLIIFMVGANNWWNMDNSNVLLFTNSRISRVSFRTFMFLDKFRVWKLFKNIVFSLGFYKERWNIWCPQGRAFEELKKKYWEFWRVNFVDDLAGYDIEEMVKICRKNDIKVVICDYPICDHHLNNIQMNISRKLDIPFVENCAVFQALPNLKDYLWQDNWHPNDKGYKLVAENIYNCILDYRLIQ